MGVERFQTAEQVLWLCAGLACCWGAAVVLALRAGKPRTVNWTGRWVWMQNLEGGTFARVRRHLYGQIWLEGWDGVLFFDEKSARLLPRWRGWLLSVWRHRHGEKRWAIDLCACAIGLVAGLILFCWVLP